MKIPPLMFRLQQGDRLPRLYGIAWTEWGSRDAVCLPIGMNLLGYALHGLYLWLRTLGADVPLNPRWAYLDGMRATEAYRQGLKDGSEHACRAMNTELDDAYRVGFQDAQTAQEVARFAATIPAALKDAEVRLHGRVIGRFDGQAFQPSQAHLTEV